MTAVLLPVTTRALAVLAEQAARYRVDLARAPEWHYVTVAPMPPAHRAACTLALVRGALGVAHLEPADRLRLVAIREHLEAEVAAALPEGDA